MGDRHWITINCAGCGVLNPSKEDFENDPMENGIYYAPSSGAMSFTCKECKKINWISEAYQSKIVSKEEEKELYRLNGFE